MIERFAGYGFNKAHSAAYAVIAAQTAYLKANYPVEFMAAVLSTDIGNTDKIVSTSRSAGEQRFWCCHRTSIAVVRDFSVETSADGTEAVRFGLGAVRNVGQGAILAILEARAEQPNQRFATLDALCTALDWNAVSRRVLESLARGGALDEFGHRGAVLANLERAIAAGQARHKAIARGQMGMFGGEQVADAADGVTLLEGTPLDQNELLAFEKESIGLYLSAHPLSHVIKGRLPDGFSEIIQLPDLPVGQTVRIIAFVRTVRRISTRQNKMMAAVEIEDLTDTIEVVLFPSTFEEFGSDLQPDQIIDVTGKLDRRNDQLQVIVESISTNVQPIEVEPPFRRIVLTLPQSEDYWRDVEVLQRIDSILSDHDGRDRIEFELYVGGQQVRVANRKHRVDWDESLAAALNETLGMQGIRVSDPVAS